jgi:hypothetical protein
MKVDLLKKLAPAALALGLAGSGAFLTSAPAWASSHSHVAAHAATKSKAKEPAVKAKSKAKEPAVKAGEACTKAELAKTVVAGKSKLICEKVGKNFKWEVMKPSPKKAAKPVAKKNSKPAAKKTTKK